MECDQNGRTLLAGLKDGPLSPARRTPESGWPDPESGQADPWVRLAAPGTQAPRHPGTQVPRYPGTQVPRYPGTQVPRYTVYKEKSRERATTAPHDKHKSVQSRGAFMH